MHTLYIAYCRAYQTAFRIGAYALPWHKPEIISGSDSLSRLAQRFKASGKRKVLLITDAGIRALGLEKPLLEALRMQDIQAEIYDRTVPNPTIANIEEALALYHKAGCGALIALGGGSPIDCAKGVGARLARPRKRIPQLRGQLKVIRRIPMLAAIPTTSGTGSETTLAAVITNGDTHEKYAINDPALIPHLAVLDPAMTLGLPPHITATTGVDALTHAVEAYIGRSNTRRTRKDALEATKLIFAHLRHAYAHGDDAKARAAMQRAAYLAGRAFTRAYVGNVHAIAHTFGGQYGTAHGLANAVILPYVLEAYGAAAHRSLANLARVAHIGKSNQTDAELAREFIEAIRALNRDTGIPDHLRDLRAKDIPLLAARALREANPLYPVPRVFDREDMEAVYRQLLSAPEKQEVQA